jgi:hypothetical protein
VEVVIVIMVVLVVGVVMVIVAEVAVIAVVRDVVVQTSIKASRVSCILTSMLSTLL